MHISRKDFNHLEMVNFGTEGIVRKLGDLALKEIDIFNESKKASIEKQYGLKVDSFAFPIERLYIKSLFVNSYKGYIYKYVNGNHCTKEDLNDLKGLVNLIKKVEEDIQKISKEKIITYDINYDNCLFNNGFHFIDTSRYIVSSGLSDKILDCNISIINSFFLKLLFSNFGDGQDYEQFSDFRKLIFHSSILLKEFNNLHDLGNICLFSEILKDFIKEFSVNTLDEYQKKVLTLK